MVRRIPNLSISKCLALRMVLYKNVHGVMPEFSNFSRFPNYNGMKSASLEWVDPLKRTAPSQPEEFRAVSERAHFRAHNKS